MFDDDGGGGVVEDEVDVDAANAGNSAGVVDDEVLNSQLMLLLLLCWNAPYVLNDYCYGDGDATVVVVRTVRLKLRIYGARMVEAL